MTGRTVARRPVAGKAAKQAGMTLIEVLVAVLVFSVGLLGLVGLQTRATQFSQVAQDMSRAALLANEMVSLMETTNTLAPPAAAVTAWSARVADAADQGLPNGVGAVAVAGGVATITITWAHPFATDGGRRYVTQVMLP